MRKRLITALALCLVALTAAFAGLYGCKQPEPDAPDTPPTPAETVYYDITFLAADDTELLKLKAEKDTVPEFTGTLPELPAETAEKTFAWEWDKPIVAATENATYKLVLKETIKEYTVKFYAEDGTTVLKTSTEKYGLKADTPVAPEKSGYAFDGWYTAKEGGEKVADFTVKGNAEYYARYVEIAAEYTVKFYAEDGTTVLKEETKKYGESVTAPVAPDKPSTDGATYTFDGWYTAKEGGEKVTDFTVKGNAEYYARYTAEAVKFNVIFYDENGLELKNYEAAYGEKAVAPEVPEKDGDEQYHYEFDGWYDETEEFDGKLVTDFTVTANSYYYARYKAVLNKYTIIFVADGVTVKEEELEYGSAVNLPETNPEKEGIVFAGWDKEIEAVTADAIYTALFGRGLTKADAANFKQILKDNPSGVFVLTEDLDFGSAQTEGVIDFEGVLEGNGYALKNLLIFYDARDLDNWESYLFASNKGTIRNLGVYYTLKANGSHGGFIYKNQGVVSNLFVSVTVEGNDGWTLGTIANDNDGGTVKNCVVVVNAKSSGTAQLGSIVGVDRLSVIKNNYAVTNGKITSEEPWSSSAALGTVVDNANYATMAELLEKADFASEKGWTEGFWKIVDGELLFGHAKPAPKPTVLTKDNFVSALTADPNGLYELGGDIDFGGETIASIETFGGTLDGKGYAIKNVCVNAYFIKNVTSTATVKNVKVEWTLVGTNDEDYTGFIQINAGLIENAYFVATFKTYSWHTSPSVGANSGTMQNIVVEMNKTEDFTELSRIGGIVASDRNGKLANCYVAHNGILAGRDDATTFYLDTWNNGSMTNCNSFTTSAELAGAISFDEAAGWNTEIWKVVGGAIVFGK